jgi:hypothetical protein
MSRFVLPSNPDPNSKEEKARLFVLSIFINAYKIALEKPVQFIRNCF